MKRLFLLSIALLTVWSCSITPIDKEEELALNGINCWDLNQNGENDPEEDFNADGVFDVLDCRGTNGSDGTDGENGTDGQDGENGNDGENGSDGQDGSNGNDGENGEDGTDGENGEDGSDGISCWDLNGNGEADIEEDTNGDGVVDVLDCAHSCKYPLRLAVKDPSGKFGNKGPNNCHWNWSEIVIEDGTEYLEYLVNDKYDGKTVPYPSQTFQIPVGLEADDFDCISRGNINL